uniref:Small integral membrane protein 26 n=1 Tax=Spermophilus dauricus TaxID=99837 RepID=A0A8C9QMY7_SPEDA
MNPERSWYRRMSMVYALGTWTLLGSAFYFCQKKKDCEVWGRMGVTATDMRGFFDVSTSEIPESPKQFYVETIVTYKEDFVPYTTKILKYLKSWTGSSGSES